VLLTLGKPNHVTVLLLLTAPTPLCTLKALYGPLYVLNLPGVIIDGVSRLQVEKRRIIRCDWPLELITPHITIITIIM
jgi:hypothetical protein